MDSCRLVQQIRCALWFEQHPDRTFSAGDILEYLELCPQMTDQILSELCAMNILERVIGEQQTAYRYKHPNRQLCIANLNSAAYTK